MKNSQFQVLGREPLKTNVLPLRIKGTVSDAVCQIAPANPLYIMWPEKVRKEAKAFLKAFPGEVMFAVKTNPHPVILQSLFKAGIKAFDVASLNEARLVRQVVPQAKLYFMHPVKAPEAIWEAYHIHGVRHFVLDTTDELHKILRETKLASDLTLVVRLALPKNGQAAIDFSCKFGALPDEAARLLQECRQVADKVGVSFHVGTQTLEPSAYSRAIALAGEIIRRSKVKVDLLDVGGGFPVSYPGQVAFTMAECVREMKLAIKEQGLGGMALLAEPGRVLVASSSSLIARVELRRGNMLYLNDGTYGGLFDAGLLLNSRFDVEAIRKDGGFDKTMSEFCLTGPTCDSLDMMKGPFILPADIGMGDWVEFKNMGAYSQGMRSDFNGFGQADTVCLYDLPANRKGVK